MSNCNPEIHHRKSIRLKRYDYSKPGRYFITINLENIRCMLAGWNKGVLELTPVGETVKKYWCEIPMHYPNTELDEFVIMPEHVHGIITIMDDRDGRNIVGSIVGARLCEATFYRVPLPFANNNGVSLPLRPIGGIPLPHNGNGSDGIPQSIMESSVPPISHEFQKMISGSIGSIVNQFKAAVTRWCNLNGYTHFKWQRNYFERILRNEDELRVVRRYIRRNQAALQKQFPGLKMK